MAMHKGKTKDAQSPFVKWKKGLKIEGQVSRQFQTQNGDAFEIILSKPQMIDGQSEKKISINGSKAGLRMALNAAGLEEFQVGDKVIIVCTGETPTTKGNARTDFELAIDRP